MVYLSESKLIKEQVFMSTNVDKYFRYEHLPEGLPKATSIAIAKLANKLNADLPDGAEKSAGMRKLLEAKDCFVRASLEIK
jgi:hypothetical protein